jgi:hypothetical protein
MGQIHARDALSSTRRFIGRTRDDDVARGFNDFRRSTAVMQIGIIHKMGLFTGEELRRFSAETLHFVEMYAPIP